MNPSALGSTDGPEALREARPVGDGRVALDRFDSESGAEGGEMLAALVLPRRNRPTRARVTTELAAE